MKHLIKTDFYRLFKAKITYISLIIAAAAPLFMTLLYLGLRLLLTGDSSESAALAKELTRGDTLLLSTFSMSSNFGLILPVFAAIIVISDVTSGTVRNKVIYGYSRHKIFLSHFLTILAYCLTLIIIYAGLTALFSMTILGHNEYLKVNASSYVYFYILGILGVVIVAAVATALSMSLLNAAGSIILSLLSCLVMGIVATLLLLPDGKIFQHVVRFFPNVVVSSFASYPEKIKTSEFLEGLAGIFLFGGAFYGIGTFIFSKRDLK